MIEFARTIVSSAAQERGYVVARVFPNVVTNVVAPPTALASSAAPPRAAKRAAAGGHVLHEDGLSPPWSNSLRPSGAAETLAVASNRKSDRRGHWAQPDVDFDGREVGAWPRRRRRRKKARRQKVSMSEEKSSSEENEKVDRQELGGGAVVHLGPDRVLRLSKGEDESAKHSRPDLIIKIVPVMPSTSQLVDHAFPTRYTGGGVDRSGYGGGHSVVSSSQHIINRRQVRTRGREIHSEASSLEIRPDRQRSTRHL